MSIAQSAESIALKTEANKNFFVTLCAMPYAHGAFLSRPGFIDQLDEVFYFHPGILLAQLVL